MKISAHFSARFAPVEQQAALLIGKDRNKAEQRLNKETQNNGKSIDPN